MVESDRIRLHITPFNATLYDNIIPKSIQPLATGISYHTVQTFPERGFGYVELPKADADKLRKKLNGATLRGQKMNIQEAKPEKRRRDKEDPKDEAEAEPRKKHKKAKSNKKDKEIAGFELPDERQVKRGWTEEPGKSSKDKKNKSDKKDKKDKTPNRERSKYSSKQEVLFKQKLPEHVKLAQKAEGKEKRDKKTGKVKDTVVVHEFEKNRPVPSFLKSNVSNATSTTTEYVAGKGWVDSEGNVVEAISVKPKRENRIAQIPDTPMEIKIKQPVPQEPVMKDVITAGAKALEDDASSEESSSESESDEDTSDDSEEEEEEETITEPLPAAAPAESKTTKEIAATLPPALEETKSASSSESEAASESGSESESSSESESEDESVASEKNVTEVTNQEPAEVMDIDSTSEPRPSTPPRDVHPLEALFKKAKPSANETPRPAPINTSFSFFGGGDEDADNDPTTDPFPQTPFTQNRVIRSAAPTPDTAAIGRKFSFSFGAALDDDIEEEDYEEEGYEDANQVPLGTKPNAEESGEKEETEFAKWFWENRGDTNRAWKKRRRDVLKQKRQRENRRLSRRVV